MIDPTASTNGLARYNYDDVGNLISIARLGTTNTTIVDFHGKTGRVGDPVTVYGAGFNATPSNNVVKFGGSTGTTATVTSSSQTILKVTVPSGASTGPIYVKNNVSKKTFTTTSNYTIVGSRIPTISSFTPKGDAAGSTGCSGGAVFTATVSGTNFEATPALNNVFVNGFRAQVASATATSLTINTPPFPTAGPLTVQTTNGQVTTSGDYLVAPDGYCSTKLESAGRITSGTSKTITVAASGDFGMALFDGTHGQRAYLDVTSVSATNTRVSIYDPFGLQLWTNTFSAPGVADQLVLPATGVYSLLVDPTNGGTPTTGSVGLTLTLSGNTTATTTLDAQTPTSVSTTARGQIGVVTFTAIENGLVSFVVADSIAGSLNTDYRLRDAAGTVIATGWLNNGSNFIDAIDTALGGTYALELDPRGTNVGTFDVTAYDVSTVTGSISIDGGPTSITTTKPGQKAALSFQGTDGQRVVLYLTNSITGCCNLTHKVTGPNGQVTNGGVPIVGDASFGENYYDTFVLDKGPGTYTYWIDPNGQNTGTFTVKVQTVPPDVTASTTIDGAPVTVTTTSAGQNANVTFDNAAAGSQVTMTVSDSITGCCNLDYKVTGPGVPRGPWPARRPSTWMPGSMSCKN